MVSQRRDRLGRSVIVLLLAAMVGCAGPKGGGQAKPTTQPIAATAADDACAQRLHDLSGGLLLYYLQHQSLPMKLSQIELPGGEAGRAAMDALICPASDQPYVYNPQGLAAPDHKSRMVVYDSVPSHGGRRWAIMLSITEGAQPQTGVLAVPERYFAAP